jgi:hypothetical protein
MVVNLKTGAILDSILHQDILRDEIILELYQKILECYQDNNPIIIHS